MSDKVQIATVALLFLAIILIGGALDCHPPYC